MTQAAQAAFHRRQITNPKRITAGTVQRHQGKAIGAAHQEAETTASRTNRQREPQQATEAAKMPFPDRASNQRINTLPGQPKPLNSQIDAIQRKMYLTASHIVIWYIQSHIQLNSAALQSNGKRGSPTHYAPSVFYF